MSDRAVPARTSRRTPCRTRRRERGVSLIIAMVMLVIIGLMSVAVLRNANSADQIATGNRLQTQASQYAQIALRFCESQVTVPAGGRVTVHGAQPTPAWTVKANWVGAGPDQAYTLQASDLSGAAPVPAHLPQCLAEAVDDPSAGSGKVFRVTARGFSPDYTADANFATVTGSVVWLQSTLYASTGG